MTSTSAVWEYASSMTMFGCLILLSIAVSFRKSSSASSFSSSVIATCACFMASTRFAIRSLSFVPGPFLSSHSRWIFDALMHLAATSIPLQRHLYISPKAPDPILSIISSSENSTRRSSSSSWSDPSSPPELRVLCLVLRLCPSSPPTPGSAPWLRSTSATLPCPLIRASSSGRPPHLSSALTSAPRLQRNRTTSRCPSPDARCSAVRLS
mmetsp:Transcript_7846/g.18040  ORF Transcript_7846/g.18040 Transcript_7846/m.18040 type:complete len:210 (+) Transcript_7846:687-1316(+)